MRFEKPSADDVSAYFSEHGADEQDARREGAKFVHFYESKSWKVGKNPMTHWRSAAAGWFMRWQERLPAEKLNEIYWRNRVNQPR
jgi:hypothetical protein